MYLVPNSLKTGDFTAAAHSFPCPTLPLWEVAGAEGIVRVHVPFSLPDLSQVEKHLGFFSSDSDNYLKECKSLTSLMT